MQKQSPDDPDLLKNIARIEYNVGYLYDNYSVKEYVKAYTAYQRSLDFWERVSTRKDSEVAAPRGWPAPMRALAYLCKIAFSFTEAAQWYLKAIEHDDRWASTNLASLCVEHPEVIRTLPEETRQILERVMLSAKNDPRLSPFDLLMRSQV